MATPRRESQPRSLDTDTSQSNNASVKKPVMAELAGIMAVIETGVKVATTLGKVSVELKNAGKEAREIARKVKLVSKVLKQIEVRIKNDQTSVDLSLVEDYILLCEERMGQAERLVTVLEKEMNSSRTWDRAKFRIRFLLEKSTFALLQQDLDSLHLTLDLYMTTLVFSQVGKNEAMLEDIQEKLAELRQDVEDDIQVRSAGVAVNAAIHTIQYNNLFASTGTTTSKPGRSERIVEEYASDFGDDDAATMGGSSDQLFSLVKSQSDIVPFDGQHSVSLSVFEDETVSNALVVFTQIQLIQKKTLRKVDFELKKGAESSVHVRPVPSMVESDLSDSQSSMMEHDIEKPFDMRNLHKDETANNKGDMPYAHGASRVTSSNMGTQSFEPLSREGSTWGLDSIKGLSIGPTDAGPARQSERETLATEYQGRFFAILNCKTAKAVQIDFSSLRKFTFPEIALDMHLQSLRYDPPQPNLPRPGEDTTVYQPPPIPSATKLGSKSKKLFTSTSTSKAEADRQKSDEVSFQELVDDCAAYVIAYAQWYTDSCRLAALTERDYSLRIPRKLKLGGSGGKIPLSWKAGKDSSVVGGKVPLGEELEHLIPGVNVHLKFAGRKLIAENMINIQVRADNKVRKLIEEGPYSEDMKALHDLGVFAYVEAKSAS